MTSQINPNNIDGAYPIAGQDNDSQGFRDNFTNTRTNFAYASAEISDLQSKAVLKAALSGTTLDNNMNDAPLVAAKIRDFSATAVALGALSGTVDIDYTLGHYQTVTTNGSISLTFSNWPATGAMGLVRLQITVTSTAYTLTLPSAVSIGVANTQGYSSDVITFNQTGTYEYEFVSSNAGSTISIFDLNRNRDPMYLPSSEDMAASAAASLTKTTSYFSTSAPETGSLAAGSPGQIKIFSAVDISSGNMSITVTNAGWKSSGTGTITFATRGAGCILQYTNSKWFVIGNNGCTFA
jgi:hypothetical protein